jgi:hypothetical protein
LYLSDTEKLELVLEAAEQLPTMKPLDYTPRLALQPESEVARIVLHHSGFLLGRQAHLVRVQKFHMDYTQRLGMHQLLVLVTHPHQY